MQLNPVIAMLGRRLRLAVIGGGPGSFIGAMHNVSAPAADSVISVLKPLNASHLLDVGGESTRPGSEGVPLDEELARVIPVIERLQESGIAVKAGSGWVLTRRYESLFELNAAIRRGKEIVSMEGDE